MKSTQRKGLKILTHKLMLQRLPIALAQVKAGNTFGIYLMKSNRSYILCIEQKKSLKKVYNNIINSIKV